MEGSGPSPMPDVTNPLLNVRTVGEDRRYVERCGPTR